MQYNKTILSNGEFYYACSDHAHLRFENCEHGNVYNEPGTCRSICLCHFAHCTENMKENSILYNPKPNGESRLLDGWEKV